MSASRATPISLHSNEILMLPLNSIDRLFILNAQEKVINALIKYPAYFKPLGAIANNLKSLEGDATNATIAVHTAIITNKKYSCYYNEP